MNQLRKAAFKSDSKSSHWDRFPMRRFFASTSTHTQTQRFGETANLSESRGEIFNKAGINAALPPSIGLLQSHSRRVTLRCCKCLKFSYNRNMKYANNIAAIDELSASEGVFTTAQAQRLGISRNALSHACKVGRLERVAHGAYRLSGAPSSETDELAAIWKLTASTAFSWERQAKWDGVAVGGSTAAWLLGIGDFHLSPYRIYAPGRINSKIESARFGVRNVDEGDMAWMGGLPVTRAERTLADLCLDCEDPSLVEGAFRDAAAQGLIDSAKLGSLLDELGENKRRAALLEPLARALSASDQKGRS